MTSGHPMQYFPFRPAAPLDEFVDVFWMIADGDAARRERILPSGTAELVINLHEDEIRVYDTTQPGRCQRFSGAVASGTYTRAFICDARQHRSIIGVHFRPGGALPFLGVPAFELNDTHVNLEDLWGSTARVVRARLCESSTVHDRFQILENALLQRLQRLPGRHPAIECALRLFGSTGTLGSTREVARKLGMCQRGFIRLFAHGVGVTPKLLCRILRFQHARNLAENSERGSDGGSGRSGERPTIDWRKSRSRADTMINHTLFGTFKTFRV
jgi:AraC-like DNA-binding protein